jgi:hypothetical protein
MNPTLHLKLQIVIIYDCKLKCGDVILIRLTTRLYTITGARSISKPAVMFGPIYKVDLSGEHRKTKLNSVVLVRKRTIPTERPQPADEVSVNFS